MTSANTSFDRTTGFKLEIKKNKPRFDSKYSYTV